MTYLVMAVMLLVAAILQVQTPSFALLGGTKMPLLLSVLLYYALSRETGVMVAAAFFAGFLHDALGGIPLGYSIVLFCLLGWLAGRFRKFVVMESLVTPVFFGFVAGLISVLVFYIILSNSGLVCFCGIGRLLMRIVGTAVLGMFCAPMVFVLARRLDILVGNIEAKEEIDVFE